MKTLHATITGNAKFSASFKARETLRASVFISSVQPETYTGVYEITPSKYKQVLNTENLLLTDNIMVNPIPSNYGLIAWNGSILKVS